MTTRKEPLDINEEPELSDEDAAILELMLKGKTPEGFRETGIPRREKFSPVPLSFGQRRLWILDRLVPGNPFYNVPLVFRLEGAFDTAVFKKSVNEIVCRHESLRTFFAEENGEPVQVILPGLTLDIPVIRLDHLSGLEREEEIRRRAAKEAMKPFDLSKGPLFRVGLLLLGPTDHVMLYTSHHIVSDTWSSDNFLRELVTLYAAFSAGKPSPLPELPVQYADYALWQRQKIGGELLEKQLSYWRRTLGEDIPLLELPIDRPRPAIQTFGGDCVSFVLPGTLVETIDALIRPMDCSLFMFLLAALDLLLCRYSGQEDILVGSPIANRDRAELERLIGYFSNTLVFRTDLSGEPTFRQLLERVRRTALGAYDNQDIPFERLVEEFQPDRYMSVTPLFQVMLVLQNVPRREMGDAGSGFTIYPVSADNKTSKFDLWMSVTRGGDTLNGLLEYNTDIFVSSTIMRFIDHFKVLLEAAVRDPDRCIYDYSLLSPGEKERLLKEWNDTAREYSICCLHRMFEEQVERTPGATALMFENRELTYRLLDEEANRLAGFLRRSGVTTDMPVGICMERSVEMVIGLLGILKAGGAYLPLDPGYPRERLGFMAADARVAVLLTVEDTRDVLPSFDGRVICLDTASGFGDYPGENPGVDVSIDSTAYVIYTSGSTGRPRGVPVPHKGICNRLLWMQEAYGLTADDRVLQKTPYSFDVSVWEFFWPLATGAVLVMARPGGHKDGGYLVEVIKEKKITTVHFVPSMLNVFLDEPGLPGICTLKRVISSGEALPVEYRERFFERLNAELHNLYGPTEASVDVTAYECLRHTDQRTVPIGRPIANTQIYILDKHQNPAPVGVYGEVYIGGIQLARGYLNNPELTAHKFCLRRPGGSFEKPPPGPPQNFYLNKSFWEFRTLFAKRILAAGGIVFKTGDLARWLPDGNIEFSGRLDFQVKLRGFRIELGEIESTLRDHPGLRDAAVIAREKLFAYVVPDTPAGDDDLPGEQVLDWQGVFNDAYTKDPGPGDPFFNIAGWNSSYTGEPIPAEEMKAWVDNTVERILSLKPGTILEIGCGTGLFLFKLIPHCRRFLGTDISQVGLTYIRHQLENRPEAANAANVELMRRKADNFDGIADGELDLVILNSVIQYFPSARYLVDVLKGAASKIKPGGYIFIGDVRSLPLLEAFHASVEAFKAEPDTPGETVLRRALSALSREQELAVSPAFFHALKKEIPLLEGVELLHKYGGYANELFKFRYDVILHIGTGTGSRRETRPPRVLGWKKEKLDLAGLRRYLTDAGDKERQVVVTGVPNRRVSADINLLKRLRGANTAGAAGEPREETGFVPGDFPGLAGDLPYRVSVTLAGPGGEGDPGTFDVVFTHRDIEPQPAPVVEPVETHPWETYSNNPLLVKLSGTLVPELKRFLKDRLPEYMVPSQFVLLDRLPLTPNGKLDRRALPVHEPVREDGERQTPYVEPSTDTEKLLVEIWKNVLFLDRVGTADNFFELGGDSINAIQVISRANREGYRLTIRDLYRNLTPAELAACADESRTRTEEEETGEALLPGIDMEELARRLPPGVEIEAVHPLTSFQKHMLSYYLYDPAGENEPGLFVTYRAGVLPYDRVDMAVLEKAFAETSRQYPYLRTAFVWENLAEPVQIVYKKGDNSLQYRDWSGLPPEGAEKAFEQFIDEEYRRGFERDKPRVYRISIVKIAEADYRFLLMADYMRVDGWSTNLVLGYFIEYCIALAAGTPLPEPDPGECDNYKHFHAWLRKQDETGGEPFWRAMKEKGTFPTPLSAEAPGNLPGQGRGFAVRFHYLSPGETEGLESFLKKNRLVLSTLGWAAWSVLLARYTGRENVMFGVLVSGRAGALDFIETMVGQTLNALPAGVEVPRDKPLLQWLREIWEVQMELNRYDYTPQDKIREWLDVPTGTHLFESYLVVMNFPGVREGMKKGKGPSRTVHNYIAQLEYPLRVDLYPGRELCLIMHYYRRYFTDQTVKTMLDDFYTVLMEMIENPLRNVGEFLGFSIDGKNGIVKKCKGKGGI